MRPLSAIPHLAGRPDPPTRPSSAPHCPQNTDTPRPARSQLTSHPRPAAPGPGHGETAPPRHVPKPQPAPPVPRPSPGSKPNPWGPLSPPRNTWGLPAPSPVGSATQCAWPRSPSRRRAPGGSPGPDGVAPPRTREPRARPCREKEKKKAATTRAVAPRGVPDLGHPPPQSPSGAYPVWRNSAQPARVLRVVPRARFSRAPHRSEPRFVDEPRSGSPAPPAHRFGKHVAVDETADHDEPGCGHPAGLMQWFSSRPLGPSAAFCRTGKGRSKAPAAGAPAKIWCARFSPMELDPWRRTSPPLRSRRGKSRWPGSLAQGPPQAPAPFSMALPLPRKAEAQAALPARRGSARALLDGPVIPGPAVPDHGPPQPASPPSSGPPPCRAQAHLFLAHQGPCLLRPCAPPSSDGVRGDAGLSRRRCEASNEARGPPS